MRPSFLKQKKYFKVTFTDLFDYEYEYCKLLLSVLHLNYESVPFESGRRSKNGSRTGTIGKLQQNKIDILFSAYVLDENHEEYAWSSFPTSFTPVVFATKSHNVKQSDFSLINPFQTTLWVALIAMLLFMIVTLKVLLKKKLSYSETFAKPYAILLRQSIDYSKIYILSDRILLLTFAIGLFLLSTAYCSVILSTLTVPPKGEVLETIPQLAKALERGTHRCAIFEFSPLRYLLSSRYDTVRYIGRKIKENDWIKLDEEHENFEEAFNEENYVLIAPIKYFAYEPRYMSQLLFSKEQFQTYYASIYTSRTFCCKKAVNSFILKTMASGIYEKMERDYHFKEELPWRLRDKTQEKEQLKQLTVSDLSEAFIIFGIGMFLSFISFCLERFNNI